MNQETVLPRQQNFPMLYIYDPLRSKDLPNLLLRLQKLQVDLEEWFKNKSQELCFEFIKEFQLHCEMNNFSPENFKENFSNYVHSAREKLFNEKFMNFIPDRCRFYFFKVKSLCVYMETNKGQFSDQSFLIQISYFVQELVHYHI